jgi:hypothetical protein
MNRLQRSLTLLTLVATAAFADTNIQVNDGGGGGRRGNNVLLLNPGDLFSGVLSLEYEHALSPYFGLTAAVSVWTFHGLFSPPSDPYFTGISPEIGARVHFIRDAPGGLWLGPYISAGYVISRSDGSLYRAWSWGVGAALGYNFIIARVLALQLGVGGGFIDLGDRLVWAPRLRLGIGFVF